MVESLFKLSSDTSSEYNEEYSSTFVFSLVFYVGSLVYFTSLSFVDDFRPKRQKKDEKFTLDRNKYVRDLCTYSLGLIRESNSFG